MLSREYEPGDERDIFDLFYAAFGRRVDPATWQWRFVDNPYGAGIIQLMYDNDRLVGHYAVAASSLSIDGRIHRAGMSVTTMTHPDYRGRGIFTQLASEAYDRCERVGMKVVFGFPNENSYHGFLTGLGWYGFGRVVGWTTMTMPEKLKSEREFTCVELRFCDEQVDSLWARAGNRRRIVVPRTSEFLNWRYFYKPGTDYSVHGFYDDKGMMQGLVVLKVFRGRGRITGHVVDYLATREQGIPQAILNRSIDYFNVNGVTGITCWTRGDDLFSSQVSTLGFTREECPAFHGVLVLDDTFVDRSLIEDVNNWSFTMGDSDVY